MGGIARAIYDRVFKWLIAKCNGTLCDATMKKANFVAVLDIAGFEIFEYNGFEQISINFVNEKLQQFFNHHMFVVEQEEYVSEGIDWVMVDFGMDLQAAIIMFEKPVGVLVFSMKERDNCISFCRWDFGLFSKRNLCFPRPLTSHSRKS